MYGAYNTRESNAEQQQFNLPHLGAQLLLADVRGKIYPWRASVSLGQPFWRPMLDHLHAQPAVAVVGGERDASGGKSQKLGALLNRALLLKEVCEPRLFLSTCAPTSHVA